MELEELGEPDWATNGPQHTPVSAEEYEPEWVDAYEF